MPPPPPASSSSPAANKFGPTNNNSSSSPAANKFGDKFGANNNNSSTAASAASKFGEPAKPAAAAPPAAAAAPASATTAASAKPNANPASQPAAAPAANVATPAAAAPVATTPAPAPAAAAPAAAAAAPDAVDKSIVNNNNGGDPAGQAVAPVDDAVQPQQPDDVPHVDEHGHDDDNDGGDGGHDEVQLPPPPPDDEEDQGPPPDPDANLQPAVRRLMQIVEPLSPTFVAMLAGDFLVPWPKSGTQCPPFDPLAQRSVKKALQLRGDSAMALHSLCITRNKTIVIVGANGLILHTIPSVHMRKINLIRATRDVPAVLIVDLVDPERGPDYRATGFYVLLSNYTSGDRCEMSVKNSLAGVPYETLSAPPVVQMPDLDPLLRRMRRRVEEHDALIEQRAALLERIRKLQFQNAARDAVAKLTVECADAPAQEHARQAMLNLLVNYCCSNEARSKGDFS